MSNSSYIESELRKPYNIDCFGVTFLGESVIEEKCYRYNIKMDGKYISNFCFVKNNDSHYFRVIPSEKIDYSSVIKEFGEMYLIDASMKLFEEIANISMSGNKLIMRLTQLGIQKQGFSNQVIKAYYSLRKFKSVCDSKGEKQSFCEVGEIIKCVNHICGVEDYYYQNLYWTASILEKYNYFPSLLGINYSKNHIEVKLYFELFSYENYVSIIKNSREVICEICKKTESSCGNMISVNKMFVNKCYFLRGVALSNIYVHDKHILRFYYSNKNRFI